MFWQWYILFSILLLNQYMSRGRRTYLLLTILKIFFDIKNNFIYLLSFSCLFYYHLYPIIDDDVVQQNDGTPPYYIK